MRKQLVGIALAGAAGCVVAPMPALAQSQAVTNAPVYLYAGPASDYPVVAQLPGNASVSVMGCVAGYSWCDVVVPGARGWVYGGALYYPYQGSTVPAINYGAALGVPIIGFALGSYWNSYYRDRPWYHDQSRWAHHAPPRPVPPPHFVGHGPVHGAYPGGRPGQIGGPRPGAGPGHAGGPRPGPRPGPGHVGGRPPGAAPGHAPGRPPVGGPGHVGGRPPGAGAGHPGGRPPGAAPGGRPGGGGPGPGHGGPRPGGGGAPHGGGGGARPGGGGHPGGGEHGGGGGGRGGEGRPH